MNNNANFKKSILGMQGNLLSFALKLTLNKDEAHDLVQDTTLKALTMKTNLWKTATSRGGCSR